MDDRADPPQTPGRADAAHPPALAAETPRERLVRRAIGLGIACGALGAVLGASVLTALLIGNSAGGTALGMAAGALAARALPSRWLRSALMVAPVAGIAMAPVMILLVAEFDVAPLPALAWSLLAGVPAGIGMWRMARRDDIGIEPALYLEASADAPHPFPDPPQAGKGPARPRGRIARLRRYLAGPKGEDPGLLTWRGAAARGSAAGGSASGGAAD